ncbi:sodium/potassium-transporting ATPase subunit beta-2 [Fopius arisanus]|uniref:Nrv2_1 protein n=1 Tax=Fopius arisanus TaxID=64838 RepID=A0A0C9RLC5_9HYME|nr:PREDICTED: sodium/potassium-transporting ATPase subunit beta-2-like [Fopius arisanus]
MVAKDPRKELVTESMNPYEKPPSVTTRQSIKNFLYNPLTGAFLGRTPSRWGKIGIFYLIFYGVLAALVAICYCAFSTTLDPRIPKWQLERSIIGTNPGMGFRPMPPADNVESTLIWFKGTNASNYDYWIQSLKAFLKPYKEPGSEPGRGQNGITCDYGQEVPKDKVCTVNVRDWGPCTEEGFFGYHKSSPCVFLKLNKIYGWIPEYYNETKDLPSKMPEQLKGTIRRLEQENSLHLNTIWVSCEGENPADQENIGPIRFYPKQGFPGYYYPYYNNVGYFSPLVAVQFERPRPGIIINVECKAWAKNIKHHRNDKIGSVHFELLID